MPQLTTFGYFSLVGRASMPPDLYDPRVPRCWRCSKSHVGNRKDDDVLQVYDRKRFTSHRQPLRGKYRSVPFYSNTTYIRSPVSNHLGLLPQG